MNSKANMEFTLFLNTKYRITMSLSLALGDDSIHLLKSFESNKKVFDEVTGHIRDSAAEHGLTFLEYKQYRGEDGVMVFVECGKALAAYKKELIDRGYIGSKITSVVVTEGVEETGIASDYNSHPPATTKIGENGRVYENYPAILKLA
jgi:hypothetical protein